jgi:hypothetical protein
MAWQHGTDPYQLFNTLDKEYRPLTWRHECPACWTHPLKRQLIPTPCSLCGGRQFIEIPRDRPGEPMLPPRPSRVRAFIYGCGIGLRELEAGRAPRMG